MIIMNGGRPLYILTIWFDIQSDLVLPGWTGVGVNEV